MLKVGVIGTGYVGLVHGAALSSFDLQVACMDVDERKIELLRTGKSPIYEPGLEQLLNDGLQAGNLSFTTSAQEVVQQNEVIFIAVGTPSNEDGSANLSYVLDVVKNIAKHMNGYKLIVCKSTLPVGTCRTISGILTRELQARNVKYRFDVVSNPEFLRQGKAVSDSLSPSRVVLGVENEKAKILLQSLYRPFAERQVPFLYTNLETAEMIKYASNSFLAVKISYINELALLAEKVGANTLQIAEGMGMDERISPHFLQPGPGYGGSCFPKDTLAMAEFGKQNGEELYMVQAAIQANEKQKAKMVEKISLALSSTGNLFGKTVAVWGLTFKPDTDDIRYAPSLDIIKGLSSKGALIKAYCPEGMPQAERYFAGSEVPIEFCGNASECAQDADALVLITEWEQFRQSNWNQLRSQMRGSLFFDLRNMFVDDKAVHHLFHYYSIGANDPIHSFQEAQ